MSHPSIRLIKCGSYSSKMPNKIRNGGYCSLYIAPDKMIVAPLKADLLYVILPWAKMIVRSRFKKAEENLNLPIDSILSQDKANYQILNNSVNKLEMKKGKFIAIQTVDGKHGFYFTKWEANEQDTILEYLKMIFGKRFVLI